ALRRRLWPLRRRTAPCGRKVGVHVPQNLERVHGRSCCRVCESRLANGLNGRNSPVSKDDRRGNQQRGLAMNRIGSRIGLLAAAVLSTFAVTASAKGEKAKP